eukprot:TRINITY_DN695_c0_g1_i1.p1 TRINITY_DN695_c0_g1~~TRINITY_DN695_c0_g1_i1.p1  ORF type:complete len:230 (-),score=60.19 TRINITY_DN695_c0_g1_i1:270-959(-)
MQRFFGSSKKVETPTLSESTQRVDGRIAQLDSKIGKLEAELRKYRDQIKRTRPGPAQNSIKQRAMRTLKQKKMYENQREQLMGQAFNMEQTQFLTENLQDTVTTVASMKEANKTLQKQFKQIKVEEVEDMYDDLQDIMEESNMIQESLSRAYAVPDGCDEEDLDAELEALGDELDFEEAEGTPSYLMQDQGSWAMPEAPTAQPAWASPDQSSAQPARAQPIAMGQQAPF